MTHYIIVRGDLPHGFQAAQIVHAVGESLETPHPPHTNAVVLQAENEKHLLKLSEELREQKIPHIAVSEPDPPYNGQTTAIGVFPVADRQFVKDILRRLPLLGKHLRPMQCDNARSEQSEKSD